MTPTKVLLTSVLGLFWASAASATVVYQGATASYISFVAATAADQLIPGTPESWVATNDATASAGQALYTAGVNDTVTAPHSFALYKLQFSSPGTYYLYDRWRADAALTGGDPFTANSAWLPNTFGSITNAGDVTQSTRSDSNNGSAPADNTYAWVQESVVTYTVTAGDLSAPLILSIGTREAGMMFDRFVLSTTSGLTSAQLDVLANSQTDVIPQGTGANFIAWQAEHAGAVLIPGTPESWVITNDATANGGQALYASGVNDTVTAPHSFVLYKLRFATNGTYYLYDRWRADAALTGGDPFTANSAWLPNTFGSITNAGDVTQSTRSDSNNGSAPADNTYAWVQESVVTYNVAAGDLAAPLILSIGTREAGMLFDRFVLSMTAGLTAAQLDALSDSGVPIAGPTASKAVGSASLDTVTVTFSKPLDPASVSTAAFQISGGVSVTNATLVAADPRQVVLLTSPQSQGTNYTVTVNGVKDTDGGTIAPNSTVKFTAWRLVTGWVTKEIYYFGTNANTSIADILALPTFPGSPDSVQWVKDFQLYEDPYTAGYAARMSTLFTPTTTDTYKFYVTDDDQAELQLSSDTTEANLQVLQDFDLTAPPFNDASSVASPSALTAGKSYLLRALLRQAAGDVYLSVAAQPASSSVPPEQLSALGGNSIGTFINPDLGAVKFDNQPTNVTAAVGTRARFAVKAESESLQLPIFYQWRVNGTNIPGAIRPAYTTPVLSASNNGEVYSVVVSVAGSDTVSSNATLAVVSGEPPNLQPYIGLNFAGGGNQQAGGVLTPVDVAGATPQANWNNLSGFTFDTVNNPLVLVDAEGAASPVTLTAAGGETWSSGSLLFGDADSILLQGHIDNLNAALDISIGGVPAGNYNVLVYSLGFPFQASYEQALTLTGATVSATFHVKAQTYIDYSASPGLKRMSSTNAAARDLGNYVQFDNVSPANGTFSIAVVPESPNIGNNHLPPVSAIQLVKVLSVAASVRLSATLSGNNLTVGWTDAAQGYVLESSGAVGSGASWTVVPGSPNPIQGSGSVSISTASSGAKYFRLRK